MNAIACSMLGRAYEQMSHLAAPDAELKNHGAKGCNVVVNDSFFVSETFTSRKGTRANRKICLDKQVKMNNS